MTVRRLVCVHNRARDHYEVALALEEAGLLESLVTDLYLPGVRSRAGLPLRKVRTNWRAAILQYSAQLLGRAMGPVFARTDAMLAQQAARLAARRGTGVYAYSTYLDSNAPSPVLDFEYHPDPALGLEILAADRALWPAVEWSWAREQAVAANEPTGMAWRHADAVVCASAFTRRALIHAGCPADRIAVIPYGASETTGPPAPRANGACRFLFVGQGVQRKGLHHLAAAWRSAALGDAKLIVVAHLLDPGIAQMLDQPGITVLGRQSRSELDDLFATTDSFVMPSLVEGFGLVYLEALAAGCHVVGTANTGLPDLDLPESAVTIVAPGDVERLAAVLMDIAGRKQRGLLDPLAIGAAGTQRTMADFRRAIAAHAASVLS